MDARHWNGDDAREFNAPEDYDDRCDCGATGCMTCDPAFVDPQVGDQVTMPYEGRVLLGDVTGIILSPAGVYLIVRHFNREPWPLCPVFDAVSVLSHTWPEPNNEGDTL